MEAPAQPAPSPVGSSYPTALAVWIGAAVAATGVIVWLATLGPGETTICLLRHWTGVPCPGCGVTRSIAALLHGGLGEALTLHPLAPVAAAEALVGWIAWGVSLTRRRRGLDERWLAALLLANLAAFVALWIVRAATGTLPR